MVGRIHEFLINSEKACIPHAFKINVERAFYIWFSITHTHYLFWDRLNIILLIIELVKLFLMNYNYNLYL